MIADFQQNVLGARENYKTALERIRVEQLIKKDEDLPWFLSLALDLAGGYLLGAFARALKTATGPGLAELQRLVGARQLAGSRSGLVIDTTWTTRAQGLLAKVTPDKIEAVAKAGFDPAKAAAKQSLAQTVSGAPDLVERAQTISYVDRLTNSCDVAFYRFKLDASGHADDAELVVLWHGMKPQFHYVTEYQAALAQEIERFKKSGANDIGEKTTRYVDGTLRRETRVIFVRDIHGETVPWYEHQITDIYDRGRSTTGDPQPKQSRSRGVSLDRDRALGTDLGTNTDHRRRLCSITQSNRPGRGGDTQAARRAQACASEPCTSESRRCVRRCIQSVRQRCSPASTRVGVRAT